MRGPRRSGRRAPRLSSCCLHFPPLYPTKRHEEGDKGGDQHPARTRRRSSRHVARSGGRWQEPRHDRVPRRRCFTRTGYIARVPALLPLACWRGHDSIRSPCSAPVTPDVIPAPVTIARGQQVRPLIQRVRGQDRWAPYPRLPAQPSSHRIALRWGRHHEGDDTRGRACVLGNGDAGPALGRQSPTGGFTRDRRVGSDGRSDMVIAS